MSNLRNLLIIAIFLLALLLIIYLLNSQLTEQAKPALTTTTSVNQTLPDSSEQSLNKAEYVGREACKSCHQQEYEAWSGSDHDLAMQQANTKTVLGDFSNTQFNYHGVTSTFYKKDNRFFVKTDNAEGQLQDFEIKYTFGVRPLQQYLIEFPGGNFQALNVVWDARPKVQGGQHWLHLYPDENVDHTDPLHWTGVYQNWNGMCAECHSTNLRKNYNLVDDVYTSTWSEMNVSCEACHGPASNHVQWAHAAARNDAGKNLLTKGLVIELGDPGQGLWVLQPDKKIARRSVDFNTSKQLDTCARCHSRRGVLTDDYRHGKPFLDTHVPALLSENLYYADGQIKDEVYVYGSFLQSKMYQAGVICSDCHEPHSLKLTTEGNDLCCRCHRAEQYDNSEHHHHKEASAGAQCVSCHMPDRNYMVVDARRDHSLRIPRPDLTVKLGTPNACNACHDQQTAQWAIQQINAWYPENTAKAKHYGEIIDAGRRGLPHAAAALAELALNIDKPGMVRATAISLLSRYTYPELPDLLRQTLQDADPLIRTASLNALVGIAPRHRFAFALPLLMDPVRLVRTSAANILLDLPAQPMHEEQLKHLKNSLQEYIQAQEFNADRPESLTNLGTLYMRMHEMEKAESYFKQAIHKVPAFAQAYVNLADLYRAQNRDLEGEKILHQGLQNALDKAAIHHSLGLALVRQQKTEDALQQLEQAANLAPELARYQYVYGIALQSVKGTAAAITYLKKAYKLHPADVDILYALASFSYESSNLESARKYAHELLRIAPQHSGAQQLLAQ